MVLQQQDVVDAFHEYIFNEIPSRLIYVPEMKMVGREYVKDYFQDEMESHIPSLMYGDIDVQLKRIVKYTILSHRWLPKGEPTFQELSDGVPLEGAGAEKLDVFCEKTVEYDCVFAWVDTCCINKSNSSELDEAIRSMFRWYRNSHMCIAYLAHSSSIDDLSKDPWFTRGWTLQELLAPTSMKFFGMGWIPLSDNKDDKWEHAGHTSTILGPISTITNIPRDQVRWYQPGLEGITQKLSWVSGRRTTRVEDIAYSLVGMLDISLMIAYGEGHRAFFRLMETIIENTSDCEIFGWKGKTSAYCSALPAAPSCYPREAREHWGRRGRNYGDSDFTLANGKFRIKVLLVPMEGKSKKEGAGGSTVFTFTDPNHTIQDVTVVFGDGLRKSEVDDYQTSNLALGILDYSNEGGKGVLQHKSRDPYIAFLLTPYDGEWRKMETENLIEVVPQTEIKKELTALRLGQWSAKILEKTAYTRQLY